LVVDLQQRKNAILRVCYNKKGEYAQPDLSRLNEDAFKELQRIDKEITKLTLQQGVDIDQKQGEMPFYHVIVKNPVMYNSEQTYFDHLLQQAQEQSKHNPNAVKDFYDTYTYTTKKGSVVPLRCFFYTSPAFKQFTLSKGVVDSIIQSPIGALNEVDNSSYYVNPNWNSEDPSAVQPLKKDQSGNVLYDNTEKFE
jgi:hypothetical protein